MSTHGKSKRRRHHIKNFHARKRRGGSRGSAHFVIPVTGSSLGSAAHKYQLGKNAKKEIAYRGTGNAFLIEIPHLTSNGLGNGLVHLELHENGLAEPVLGSPSSRGLLLKDTPSAFIALFIAVCAQMDFCFGFHAEK